MTKKKQIKPLSGRKTDLINRYEQLRQAGSQGKMSREHLIFLNEGMHGWINAWLSLPQGSLGESDPPGRKMAAPKKEELYIPGIRNEIVHVLTAITMAQMGVS